MILVDFYEQFIVNWDHVTAVYIVENEEQPLSAEIYLKTGGDPLPMFAGDLDDCQKMMKSLWHLIAAGKNVFQFGLKHLSEQW